MPTDCGWLTWYSVVLCVKVPFTEVFSTISEPTKAAGNDPSTTGETVSVDPVTVPTKLLVAGIAAIGPLAMAAVELLVNVATALSFDGKVIPPT